MWFGVVTLFPELVDEISSAGVFGRARENDLLQVATFNPRDFTDDKHRTVDDKPYGGGAGMVMRYEPLSRALTAARHAAAAAGRHEAKTVMLTPQGSSFTQSQAVAMSREAALILVCGRYEGVDERFIASEIDMEWSIGDYVLSGGELPALIVMDAIARHLPGVLGNPQSNIDESHLDGTLDYPHYTRPEETDAGSVPEALLSGDHARVSTYRRREALQRTFARRPDLLVRRVFSARDQKLLEESCDR